MEIPAGRHDEVPKLSRSRSAEVLGTLAAEISVPRCPNDLFGDVKLGSTHTDLQRSSSSASETSPCLSRRHVCDRHNTFMCASSSNQTLQTGGLVNLQE